MKGQLISKAETYIDITEKGGDNRGVMVEMFQKAVDDVAQGEPWCAAFICYCIRHVEMQYGVLSGLKLSEHCMTLWNLNPAQRREEPKPGYIVVWKKKGTTSGHVGLVTKLTLNQPTSFCTIEGNTGPGTGVQREGDGVYAKTRSMSAMGDMQVLGFLEPWA